MKQHFGIAVATVAVLFLFSLLRTPGLSNDVREPVTEIGKVLCVDGLDEARVDRDNSRLRFCIFDREKNDVIFVACSGGWYGGHFNINYGSKVVANVKAPDLLFTGALIPVGDVVNETTKTPLGIGGPGLHITDVGGTFK